MERQQRVRDFALPSDVAKVVGVYINGVVQHPRDYLNGVVQHPRDYRVEHRVVHLRAGVCPFRDVGVVGNILTALCATVLPKGDEVDAIVDTKTGRLVVRLVPS